MEGPFPRDTTTPSRLYAFLLRLRPLQQGTLMPFSGELVHGALLRWLHVSAPDVATWLHEGQKRRLFTCSSLSFGQPWHRMLHAEQENIHLPLRPDGTYLIRITLLLGELFPLLYEALTRMYTLNDASATPFIQLGKQRFLLEELVMNADEAAGWAGSTTLHTLVDKAKTLRMGAAVPLTLEFNSLTTFSRGGNREGEYGSYYARLPMPSFVFSNLAKRWQDIAPLELASHVQPEAIESYVKNDGVVVWDYDLNPHHIHLTTHEQPGFIGSCTYHLRGPDAPRTPEVPLTVRQQLWLLSQIAFYTGVGYKTAMGLGQARVVAIREGRGKQP
jgi:CRISPR-associated endoribonuclease Cas6